MSRIIKIVIVEPSVIIRNGIIAVLQKLSNLHMEVFEVIEAEQLKSSLNWKKPDILIMNPSVIGILSLAEIRKESSNPELKCIALQNSLSDQSTLKVFDDSISIYDSVEQINEKLEKLTHQPSEEEKKESLTLREKEIIVCVIKGMKNKEIAEKLYLSSHTVITHRRNIASKLQIHSTAGLTIYAIVNKLVELDEIKQ